MQVINGQWIQVRRDWSGAVSKPPRRNLAPKVYLNLHAVPGLAIRYTSAGRYELVALVDLDDDDVLDRAIPLEMPTRADQTRSEKDLADLFEAIAPAEPEAKPASAP